MVGNCYLVKTSGGYVLIDTARKSKRKQLEKVMRDCGCGAKDLSLIILTHGDFDHTGICAYLREKYGVPILLHLDDFGMVERGDMFWNRQSGNKVMRRLVNLFFGITKFSPDFPADEDFDLTQYGLDARILSIPGHSKGSIGILTSGGDLFCGDLLMNTGKPTLGSIIDDREAADASVQRLKTLKVKTVYPGHGKPFPMRDL